MKHKNWTLPEVDLSHDEGDLRWHEAGGEDTTPVYREDGTIRHYTWNGLGPGHYASYYKLCVHNAWRKTVKRYETSPGNVYHAWWYIDTHPVFWVFDKNVHGENYPWNHVSNLTHEGAFHNGWPVIIPHMVNPENNRISRDRKKNTKLAWWYEFGPVDLTGGCKSLDWELEGAADSYDAAVLVIARKIHRYYGNDRRLVDSGHEYWENRKVKDRPAGWGEVFERIKEQRKKVQKSMPR